MKAAVLIGQNTPLVIPVVEIPGLAVGQVLVKIQYSGICGKQVDEVTRKRGEDPFLPHLSAHEGAGKGTGKNIVVESDRNERE